MSAIKRVFLSFFCVLLVLTSFIFPASAVDSTFRFLIPNPVQNGADGYVVLPYRYSSSYIPANCIWWTITTVIEPSVNGSEPTVAFSQTPTSTSITFGTNDSNAYYLLNIYYIWNGDDNENNISVDTRPLRLNSAYTFTLNFPTADYPGGYFLKPSVFSGLTAFSSTASTGAFSYDVVFAEASPFYTQLNNITSSFNSFLSNYITKTDITNSRLDTLISELNTVINHFVSLLSKVDYTNEQLDTIVSQFTELLDVAYNIDTSLSDFVYYYWSEFTYSQLPEHINAIASRLDLILNALNRKGESEQTTADTSKVDNYVDIEQSLVNNDEAKSAVNDMDVSISGQAYSFIWDLITRILNSHPEVFGLIIAILTLGFIALLLNR